MRQITASAGIRAGIMCSKKIIGMFRMWTYPMSGFTPPGRFSVRVRREGYDNAVFNVVGLSADHATALGLAVVLTQDHPEELE